MNILNDQLSLERFFTSLARAPEKILLLDYDGTLAPFTQNRDEARPYDGVVARIDNIMAVSRVVLISGRWSKDLLRLIQLQRRPEIWGSHGWEHVLPDGTCTIGSMDEGALAALANVEDWLDGAGLSERCEPKPACLAVHWRGLGSERMAEIRRRIDEEFPLLNGSELLQVCGFDGGIEFRVPGRSKGSAIQHILAAASAQARLAFLGDDLTDEDAFAALGERGLKVLVRREPRSTAADLHLQPPRELLWFLDAWHAACAGGMVQPRNT